jgi:hypothetical protein
MEDGQLGHARRSCGEKIVLSIYTRSYWQKRAWRKAAEPEALAIFVNDKAGEEAAESGRKIVG